MKVEITVKAYESAFSYGILADKELVLESDDPAIFQIGPTAQAMLAKVVAKAQAALAEAASPDAEEE